MKPSTQLKLITLISVFVLLSVFHMCGVLDFIFADSFQNFEYPLELNMRVLVKAVNNDHTVHHFKINPYKFGNVIEPSSGCEKYGTSHLSNGQSNSFIVVVKSSVKNFERRQAIRRTWGNRARQQHRTVFLLASSKDKIIMKSVVEEASLYDDIVLANFVDHYNNNTYKAMLGLLWVSSNCAKTVEFAVFLDDDYFFWPDNLRLALNSLSPTIKQSLFTGHALYDSRPIRQRYSKWYTDRNQYPYSRYPPYLTAGAYVMNMELVREFYIVSEYVKYIPFDDVFLGIIAWKLHIFPVNNDLFSMRYVSFDEPLFLDLIASHEYGQRGQLEAAWAARILAARRNRT